MEQTRRDALQMEYAEVQDNFRTLTDIRFKLLSYLALVSGATFVVACVRARRAALRDGALRARFAEQGPPRWSGALDTGGTPSRSEPGIWLELLASSFRHLAPPALQLSFIRGQKIGFASPHWVLTGTDAL